MQPSQAITAMAGFTADFFGALETTFTDNSLNNSKCEISQQNPNRSQLIRELREDSAIKISQLMVKIIKDFVFEQIFICSLKKKRLQDKTPLNIHKQMYRLQLMVNLKNSSKMQFAFHRLTKFTQQFCMRDLINNRKEEIQQAPQPAAQPQPVQQKPKQIISAAPIMPIIASISQAQPQPQPQPQLPINRQLDTSKSIIKDASELCEVLSKLTTTRRELEFGMRRIREYQDYKIRKLYIGEMIGYLANRRMREAFLALISVRSRKQEEKDELPQSRPTIQKCQKETNVQAYGLEQNLKLSQIQKSVIKEVDPQVGNSIVSEKKLARPAAGGLKFNRCFKKKTEQAQKQQKSSIKIASPLPSLTKKVSSIKQVNQAKIVRIPIIKTVKISSQLSENSFTKGLYKDFNSFQKAYHLTPQDLKGEVPDMQDQMIAIEDRMSESRSSSKEKVLTFSRLHKLDNTKPLQFSSKKQKNRLTSSSKSKKSLAKSQQQQPQAYNVQSLKSYYFPQDQKYGKAILTTIQQPSSTKYIGSPKWAGQSKKRTATTNENHLRTMKSNEKANPYLQELREKVTRKKSERGISLNKMVERSVSARSNSKTSKTSREDRKVEVKDIVVSSHVKYGKTRTMSPQIKVNSQATRTPQAQVPKQWYFQNVNGPTLGSALRNINQSPAKASLLQFQKLSKPAPK